MDRADAVLEALHARARVEDAAAQRRVADREAQLGARLSAAERYVLYGDAPLAISPEAGALYEVLVATRRPRLVVEYGASHGISTIHLARALAPSGGRLVTTEILPAKADATRRNLAEAGLSELVELRVGDARETLRELPDEVDVLVLDGRNDHYVAVLELVAPRVAPGALVIADLSPDDPDLARYRRHVRDAGYASVTVPLDAGIELSVATTS